MRVSWKVFQSGGRTVEAQCFEPEQASLRLILFCPGFPGMGAVLFEQRHAASLVEEGYAVVVLRHAGIRFDSPYAAAMVNNASRLRQGRLRRESYTGGGPSTIETWLHEPLTALQELASRYDDITVIGNSFGALSSLWSMTEPGAPVQNIRHMILYAGAQGVSIGVPTDIMRIWQPQFIAMPKVTDKVTLGDPVLEAATLKKTYEALPQRVKALPAAIRITYLVVERDELLTLADTQAFKAAIGGRGEIVMDTVDQPMHEHGFLAHDTPSYTTEQILALMNSHS